MSGLGRLWKMPKRRLRIGWTCSDFVRHQHRTKLGAMLCGWVQWCFSKKGGSK